MHGGSAVSHYFWLVMHCSWMMRPGGQQGMAGCHHAMLNAAAEWQLAHYACSCSGSYMKRDNLPQKRQAACSGRARMQPQDQSAVPFGLPVTTVCHDGG
jgi:hypothetical protein